MILAPVKMIKPGRVLRLNIGSKFEEAWHVTRSEAIAESDWLIEAETDKSSISLTLHPDFLVELVVSG